MKDKTVETTPFVYRYFLVHRYTKEKFGPFDSIEETKSSHEKKYKYFYWKRPLYSNVMELNREEKFDFDLYKSAPSIRTKWRISQRERERNFTAPFVIINHLRDIIPVDVILNAGKVPYCNHGWEARKKRFNSIEKNLVIRKGNPNKIKRDWAYIPKWCVYSNSQEYTNNAMGYFRTICSNNEMRANAGCDAEYGEGLVRSKRRWGNLPNSWDDVHSSYWGCRYSWKHNSKRDKQWKTK